MDRRQIINDNLVERYVRGRLTAELEAEFEDYVLSCADTRQELETELALQTTLAEYRKLGQTRVDTNQQPGMPLPDASRRRLYYALAATALIAAVSLGIIFQLVRQDQYPLRDPQPGVAMYSLDIQRSRQPLNRIQKPVTEKTMLLDVELSADLQAAENDEVLVRLLAEDGTTAFSRQVRVYISILQTAQFELATPRLQFQLATDQLSDGGYTLEISDDQGNRSVQQLLVSSANH